MARWRIDTERASARVMLRPGIPIHGTIRDVARTKRLRRRTPTAGHS